MSRYYIYDSYTDDVAEFADLVPYRPGGVELYAQPVTNSRFIPRRIAGYLPSGGQRALTGSSQGLLPGSVKRKLSGRKVRIPRTTVELELDPSLPSAKAKSKSVSSTTSKAVRSLTDNLFGTTGLGRGVRALGAAGLLAGGAYAGNKYIKSRKNKK
jgi:hypothetical protein